jgi:serine phosphatase RsbU (regulator of sigma subunit)
LPAPELLRYKFRLGQGEFNENTSGEVTFSNLDPGTYRFEVKASLDGEEWSEPALLQFTIHPPFYATWWFRILVLVLLIGGIWAFVKNRTRTLRLRQMVLEETVRERTMEITLKNELLQEKNKEIMDSMLYARRIQNALFASDELLKEHLGEHFVLYKPREVVSGDFFWATKISNEKQEDRFVLCVADCTGHGVPGAFMSLLNIAFLNESVNERKLHSPEKIFGQVRKDLAHTLRMEGNEESRDGMDAVLCSFDLNMQRMDFSCANNPLVIVRNGVLLEFPADKMPVGYHFGKKSDFTLQSAELLPGDMIYLFSDGYADQFGGPVGDKAGKKFKYANLKKLFREFASLPAEVQHKKFLDTIENWKGDLEQIDDILMVGIRVPLR